MTHTWTPSVVVGGTESRSFEQCLGQLLRLVRIGRGLTLDVAAERCGGFTPYRLGRWERAERPLPVDALDALAGVYEVRATRLIEEARLEADAQLMHGGGA